MVVQGGNTGWQYLICWSFQNAKCFLVSIIVSYHPECAVCHTFAKLMSEDQSSSCDYVYSVLKSKMDVM